jgi:DUF2911 family protein
VRKSILAAAGLACLLTLCLGAAAQQTVETGVGDGGSPHVKSDWSIKGAHITIEYGRPSLKGRTIGKEVATYGQPWRTGADQATTITSDKPLKIGTISLAAGTTYTISTLPNAEGWQLMIGKLSEKGQWGIPYQQDLEIARTPMTVAKRETITEQVTISIIPLSGGATLRIDWGTVSASVPLSVG